MSIFDDIMADPHALNRWGTGIDAAGKLISGVGIMQSGAGAKDAANFEAAQLNQNAGQAQAAAQRQAFEVDRNTQEVMSRALAVAAASGGGASDPTVINIIAQTAAEGAYRKASALYSGDDRARSMRLAATAKEYEGDVTEANSKAAGFSSIFGAGTTLLKGAARDSMFTKFGGGGPKGTN